MNRLYKQILDKIEEFDNICIFRHQRPDGDACFSSLGLFQFIKDHYPKKTVKVLGTEVYDVICRNDKASLSFIEDSLAIVLDTSNINRVDDNRFIKAKYVIKIDHHPCVEHYGDIECIDDKAAAACELLADILLSSKMTISKKACEYLLCGILTDTLNFVTTNTTYKTLEIASKLTKLGNCLVSDLSKMVFDYDANTFQKISKIRTYLNIKDHFGSIILNERDLYKIGLDGSSARIHISEFNNIKDLHVWVFFTKNEKGLYDGSSRSIRGYNVNEIASKYNGGGHKNASGMKNLTLKQVKAACEEFYLLANQDCK